VTGLFHINKTTLEWYSKRRIYCESATFGLEFVAARIVTDLIVDLRRRLCYVCVHVDFPTKMFANILIVIKSSTNLSLKLRKCHDALAYHFDCKAMAANIVFFSYQQPKT